MNKKHIKNTRRQLGMSQLELSERLSVTHHTIITWENGEIAPGFYIEHYSDPIPPSWLPYALGWLLVTGGENAPWPAEDNPRQLRMFLREFELEQKAAGVLFNRTEKSINSWVCERHPMPRYAPLVMCWVRLFGARDPFVMPFKQEEADEGLIRVTD